MGQILDTNAVGSMTNSVVITAMEVVCIWVKNKTGTSVNQMLQLELSPDGQSWFPCDCALTIGMMMTDVCAKGARLKVDKAEGSESTCEVFITMR